MSFSLILSPFFLNLFSNPFNFSVLLNEPFHDGEDLANKQLKLTDLGLAREFTHSTHMTQCGTYAWMAPETITDSKFSKASDVWSFGVVLWELLTGQIPYRDLSAPAIAYGIGNGKLTLPVPATCPEELKCILHACWLPVSKKRPLFEDILQELQNSSFNVINLSQFRKMKQTWYEEIENIWRNLKRKEMELATREEETKRKEAEVEMMKERLKQQSEELRKREIDVVSRELHVLLQQQMRDMKSHLEEQQGKMHQKHPQKNVQKQQQKMQTRQHQQTAKIALKKRHLTSQTEISSPKDFCHNLTITTTHEDYAIPFLKAKALNQTWGPGSKLRSDILNFDLFDVLGKDKATIKDKSDQVTSSTVTLSRKNSTKLPKKLPNFLRKIFQGGSKRSKVNASTFTEALNYEDNLTDREKQKDKSEYEESDNEQEDNNNDRENSKDSPDYEDDEEYEREFLPKYVGYSSKDISRNRTYHGQTKYSQRKHNLAMDIAQHFQSLEDTDDNEEIYDESENYCSDISKNVLCSNNNSETEYSPPSSLSSSSSASSNWSNVTPPHTRTTQTATTTSSYPTSSSSCPTSKGYNTQPNITNRNKSSRSASNINYSSSNQTRGVYDSRFRPGDNITAGRSVPEVGATSGVRSLSSEHEFSDDLLREFDKFEQAFASLNTSSRALASM